MKNGRRTSFNMSRAGTPAAARAGRLSCHELELDVGSHRISVGGRPLALSARQFALLEFLLRRPGEVVTRAMILDGVFGYRFDPGTNLVDVYIKRLREKIDEGFEPKLLHTVRGAGYMVREAK